MHLLGMSGFASSAVALALSLVSPNSKLKHSAPPPSHPQGVRNVPNKLRLIIQRRRNEDDEDSEEMYSLVTLAEDQTTKGKGVVVTEA